MANSGRRQKLALTTITASVKSLKNEADFSKAQTALANYSSQALKSGVDFTSFKDKFQAAQKSLALHSRARAQVQILRRYLIQA